MSLQKPRIRDVKRGKKGMPFGRVIMRLKLKCGYIRMGRINLLLSEQAAAAGSEALSVCEQKLTECEKK